MAATRLFLGTQHGLRVWEGDDDVWEERMQAFPSEVIDCFAGGVRKPDTVYLGIAHGGLYRTVDGGASWERIFAGDVRAVAVDRGRSWRELPIETPAIRSMWVAPGP